MTPETPERAAIIAEEVRTSNFAIECARLDATLDALIDREGFPQTVERVQQALRRQAARRRIDGWVS